MSLDVVYADQIWHKSKCIEQEKSAHQVLYNAITQTKRNVYVGLVDQISPESENYQVIVTDNILKNKSDYHALWPEYWGTFSYNPEYQNTIPSKLFTCLIIRTCPVRQSWFYQLVRRNLINDGWVSFLLDYSYKKKYAPAEIPPGLDIENTQEMYQWMFTQGCEIFLEEHEKMKFHVPFKNFNRCIDDVLLDAKVNIVLETYFHNENIIAFSEKIFRALQLPRPFFLYCAPGAVKILRDCGFDVYDDVINHSYDNEVNQIQRQVKILDELENCKKIVYNQLLLENFEKRAHHNRQLLSNFKLQWPSKLKKVVDAISVYK